MKNILALAVAAAIVYMLFQGNPRPSCYTHGTMEQTMSIVPSKQLAALDRMVGPYGYSTVILNFYTDCTAPQDTLWEAQVYSRDGIINNVIESHGNSPVDAVKNLLTHLKKQGHD